MCQRPEPAFQRGSEASTCTLRAIKGCKQHDDYLMGDIFIGSLGKRRDGLEMAVINVHPSPAKMAGKRDRWAWKSKCPKKGRVGGRGDEGRRILNHRS